MSQVAPPDSKPTPAFLTKLYSMVDRSSEHGIEWTPDGLSFVVAEPSKFAGELLPLWYNHSKFSSFVRQLNMYGFHKVPARKRPADDNSATFQHENFRKDQPYMLSLIERKKPTVPKSLSINSSIGAELTIVAANHFTNPPSPRSNRFPGRKNSQHVELEWSMLGLEQQQDHPPSPVAIVWSSPIKCARGSIPIQPPPPSIVGPANDVAASEIVRPACPPPSLLPMPVSFVIPVEVFSQPVNMIHVPGQGSPLVLRTWENVSLHIPSPSSSSSHFAQADSLS